jgi:general secretion pathway protein G
MNYEGKMKAIRHNCRPRPRRAGFTLLEVLLVLVILGVIAALVVPNLIGTSEKSYIQATQSSVKGLENTLNLYYMANQNQYPPSLNELLTPPPDPSTNQPVKPYLDEYPKDSWGTPFNYEPPTSTTAGQLQRPKVWSNGPNRQNEQGGGDDISNAPKTQQGS